MGFEPETTKKHLRIPSSTLSPHFHQKKKKEEEEEEEEETHTLERKRVN
jgi:hypothetical protein